MLNFINFFNSIFNLRVSSQKMSNTTTTTTTNNKFTNKLSGNKSANKSVQNMDIFYASIGRAIMYAIQSRRSFPDRKLPFKCTMASHVDECGLIHVTAFKTTNQGREYAEYRLPGLCAAADISRGRRYLDQIPEYLETLDEIEFIEMLKRQDLLAPVYEGYYKASNCSFESRSNTNLENDESDLFIPCQDL